jgi:hypothetical protein
MFTTFIILRSGDVDFIINIVVVAINTNTIFNVYDYVIYLNCIPLVLLLYFNAEHIPLSAQHSKYKRKEGKQEASKS